MIAIITGIIIDTFGELRSSKADIEKDESNNCFVCSLKRDQFERKSIKFAEHIETEHNRWNYIYYKVRPSFWLSALIEHFADSDAVK